MKELELNAIQIDEVAANGEFLLQAPLYDIQTNNTALVAIQSSTTENGNLHVIQKTSPGAILNTAIASGLLDLTVPEETEKKQKQVAGVFSIELKA